MGIEKPILVDLLKQIKLKKTASPSQFFSYVVFLAILFLHVSYSN